MSEHRNAENEKHPVGKAPIPSSKRLAPRLLAGLLAAGIATASVMAFAHGAGDKHHGASVHGSGYEQIDLAHLRVLVHHVMTDVSPEQKAKIIAIAHSAEPELVAMDKLAKDAHRQKVALLLQDKIDPGAFEQARRDELQAANELSTRIDRVLADLVQIMTVEQRAKLREDVSAYQAKADS